MQCRKKCNIGHTVRSDLVTLDKKHRTCKPSVNQGDQKDAKSNRWVIAIVEGALDTIPVQLGKRLKDIGISTKFEQLQKTVLLAIKLLKYWLLAVSWFLEHTYFNKHQ